MSFLETMLNNGTELTFAVLFVCMLVYVMRTNEVREAKYQETVQILSTALTGYEDLKKKIDAIKHELERK